jgi:hypothetical protein
MMHWWRVERQRNHTAATITAAAAKGVTPMPSPPPDEPSSLTCLLLQARTRCLPLPLWSRMAISYSRWLLAQPLGLDRNTLRLFCTSAEAPEGYTSNWKLQPPAVNTSLTRRAPHPRPDAREYLRRRRGGRAGCSSRRGL